MEWLRAIPEIPPYIRGVKVTADCPCGGVGTLIAFRSTHGQLHAGCIRCGRTLNA